MKTTPHLLFAAALALGSTFAPAQEENKSQPPPSPQNPGSPAPPNPPRGPETRPQDGAQRPGDLRANSPRPADRERMRENAERRDDRDGRSGNRDRQDGPRGDQDRGDDRGHRDGPDNRSDHDRGPNTGAGDRRAHQAPPMPAPQKLTPFVGVVTMPPPPVVNAQFGLAPGFGLVVTEVLADSPAAKAGVQKFDVLTKFNDQQLVGGDQFSTLVRAQTKDTDATLTLFRKAQEQKVAVRIGEKLMSERRPSPEMGAHPRGMDQERGQAMEYMKRMQERAREIEKKMREAHEQGNGAALEQMKKMQERAQMEMREFQERMKDRPRQLMPDQPRTPQADSGSALRFNSEDVLRELRPGGSAAVTLIQPDAAVTYLTRDAKVLMKDDDGEFEIRTNDGQRQLVAKSATGETIFEGPIDTEGQRQALPDALRKKVELINAQTQIVRFDAPAFGSPEIEESVQ